jgi:hypothetical protein
MTIFVALIELAKLLIAIGALVGGVFLAKSYARNEPHRDPSLRRVPAAGVPNRPGRAIQ